MCKDEVSSDIEDVVQQNVRKIIEGAWPCFHAEGTVISAALIPPFLLQPEGLTYFFWLFFNSVHAGQCLVQCRTQKASEALCQWDGKLFVDLVIKVTTHRSLKSSKGVINCPDYAEMSELASQGVTAV